jgi:amino acid adenylation domain-containing protein
VAVSEGARRLTYRDLDRHSAALADRLHRQHRGHREPAGGDLSGEPRIAVALPRGLDAIVALLAILKAGGAYVPLDPAAPLDRLLWTLDDAGVAALVTAGGGAATALPPALQQLLDVLPARRPDLPLVRLDAPGTVGELAAATDFLPSPPPDALAYVLYTSGSTGVPKGVAVPHRAVLRLIDGDCAAFGPDEVWAQLAPLSFDAATLEIWGALLHGGRLEILPEEALAPRALGAALRGRGVTALWLTAGLFHLVAEEDVSAFGGLRQLLAGGDVVSPVAVRRTLEAHPHLRLIDGYGPTENTTFTCCADLRRWASESEAAGGTAPIGKPIAGTRVVVLDGRLRPVPAGVAGELWTGGSGLARGYLGRPDLTAERFLPDAFGEERGTGEASEPGARLYRTGDRVRFLADGDGTLEFLGRIDRQVKIRGFRVEPEEIEALLASHPAVAQAAVTVRERRAGELRLVAYVVPAAATPPVTAEGLAAWLGLRVPPYMVPAAIVPLGEMPLTPNGKIDRRRLPSLDGASGSAGGPSDVAATSSEPPVTETERQVAAVWAQVLGLGEPGRIGRRDRFFELGGDSLLALRAAARLRDAFHFDVPLRRLFESPRLAELAAWIDDEQLAHADRAELEALLAELQPPSPAPAAIPDNAGGPRGEP